ncbi:MAG: imelysin family protein [Oleiphilus sp.]
MFYLKSAAILVMLCSVMACSGRFSSETIKPTPPHEDNLAVSTTDYQAQPEYQLVKAVLLESILPKHQDLEEKLNLLQQEMQRFCIDPTAHGLTSLQQVWLTAMQSWSALSVYNFGPIDDTNAAWRFQFWPDPLNYVHRKFKSRLNGYNTAISQQELAQASVAIQGLSGLEYLLFDPATQAPGFYSPFSASCQILQATAANLVKEGEQLNLAWQTRYRHAWLSPPSEAGPAEKHKRYLEDIINGMLSSLILLKDKKLAAPLGIKQMSDLKKSERRIKPRYLESWRSRSSLDQLKANVDTMKTLYLMPKGFSWYLNEAGVQLDLDAKIKQHFAALDQQLNVIERSAYDLLEANQLVQLEALYQAFSGLYQVLRIEYMQALDLHFRFNAHDGD